MAGRIKMFKHIKRALITGSSKMLDIVEGNHEFAPNEFMPGVMAQNNYVDNKQPLESDGLMQYIDIDCVQKTHKGVPLSVRMQPNIPHNLDYLIVRIKCTPKQLRTSGLDFKIWLPK